MAERMSAVEVIEEFEWLVTNGASPWMAAAQLGKKPETLSRMLWRYGRGDLARLIDHYRYDSWAS